MCTFVYMCIHAEEGVLQRTEAHNPKLELEAVVSHLSWILGATALQQRKSPETPSHDLPAPKDC